MTTQEWLASLSSAPIGSTMLQVVADLEGTYPVLTPIESFNVDIVEESFTANLDIISLTADIASTEYSADLSEDGFESNLVQESYDVDHTD